MENKKISKALKLLAQMMELHQENPFKVKSLASAAFKVDKLPNPLASKSLAEIEAISGIGKSTAARIWELLSTGEIQELKELVANTPEGVIDMLRMKGIGPKKVLVIWKDLVIETIGELFYACNENRLVEAKGFGLKTQEEIKKAIEFQIASAGRFLYAQVEELAEDLLSNLAAMYQTSHISFTGQFRRRCEIIDQLSILIGSDSPLREADLKKLTGFEVSKISDNNAQLKDQLGLKVSIDLCKPEDFAYQLAMLTGSEEHIRELSNRLKGQSPQVPSEEALYQAAGLPFIEPELREGMQEFRLAESNQLPRLITLADLKGSLHNHSTWSDGVHKLEEMALFCRDELKLEYLGICDHSKSAFYANGLTETRVLAQHEEIDALNRQLAGFKIFKGIESDILFDGALDYPAEILATFDFVVASVHSILKMNEEKATERLIKAIENPFTTILGHPTGRMLLTRSGYPIDYKKVIDACAANGVVIEINANPVRLDLDWRWHYYAIEKGVKLSINPDAHRNSGFYDTRYGVFMARKGGVAPENCLNAMNLEEITKYFEQRKALVSVER